MEIKQKFLRKKKESFTMLKNTKQLKAIFLHAGEMYNILVSLSKIITPF